MTARYSVRCRVCPWRCKGDGPASLGLDALHAHASVIHPATS